MDEVLTSAQLRAIAVLRARAIAKRTEAIANVQHILRMGNIPEGMLDEVRSAVRSQARVAVHFHPDRPVEGRTVSTALLEDGIYRSQFETKISNGGVSAFAGGPRDEWERALFDGAYHADGSVAASERPKYGALDVVGPSDGPAPRFGCCYFVLNADVTARSTFTFGGSQDGPAQVGTLDALDDVLAALFAECFVRDSALGVPDIRPAGLIERILHSDATTASRTTPPSRNLDHYIEAQIHGPIRLAHDVALLVVDPAFRDTPTWTDLQTMADRYGFPIRTHPGFRMAAKDVPLDFRGPTMPSLAARVCAGAGDAASAGELLDARAIGAAVQHLTNDPQAWADRGSHAEVLQELKLLWHVLVRYGHAV